MSSTAWLSCSLVSGMAEEKAKSGNAAAASLINISLRNSLLLMSVTYQFGHIENTHRHQNNENNTKRVAAQQAANQLLVVGIDICTYSIVIFIVLLVDMAYIHHLHLVVDAFLASRWPASSLPMVGFNSRTCFHEGLHDIQ